MEEFKGVVYLTENLVTGKKYIGQDSTNKSSYLGSGLILKSAIKNFKITKANTITDNE